MGEALSYNSLGLYLGLAFGPPLGELLLESGGFDDGLVRRGRAGRRRGGAGGPAAGAARGTRTPRRGTGCCSTARRSRYSLGFFCSLLAVSAFLPFVALHADDLGMSNTSLALFVYGCVVVGCRLVFAKLPDRLPSLPLAASSLVLTAVGLVLMTAWQTPTGLITGAVVMAVGVTFTTPAFFAAIFATAKPSERGAAAGTASAFIDIALGFGPMALGLVAREQGIPWAFAVGAGIALLGAAWTVRLAVTPGRRTVRAQ